MEKVCVGFMDLCCPLCVDATSTQNENVVKDTGIRIMQYIIQISAFPSDSWATILLDTCWMPEAYGECHKNITRIDSQLQSNIKRKHTKKMSSAHILFFPPIDARVQFQVNEISNGLNWTEETNPLYRHGEGRRIKAEKIGVWIDVLNCVAQTR